MKDSEKAAAIGGAVAVPLVLGVALYVICVHAWMASLIWSWYAVPLGLPLIAWKSWAGLMCLRAILWRSASIDTKQCSGWENFAHVAAPWLTLFLAWVLK